MMQHDMLPTDLSEQEIELAHKIAARFPIETKLCQECIKEGKTSRIYCEGGIVTGMYFRPYFDTDGRLHHHDANVMTTGYRCSNGHVWTESTKSPCPTCGKDW